MSRKYLQLTTLLIVLITLILIPGCAKEKQAPVTVTPKPLPGELLLSPESLRSADLEIAWSRVIPLKSKERLKTLNIVNDRVYSISGRNYLVSLDRFRALPIYSWRLAQPEATLCGLKAYGENIYSIVGAELIILGEKEGTVHRKRHIGFGPVCPPARNNYFFYIPGTDRRIHVLNADNMVQVFEVSANDNGQITSVMAEDDIVVFTTDAGTIAGMMPDRPYQLWRFKATGGINGPAIYSNRNYFFSSRDTYIYCINRSRGELVWKYLAGAILTDAPEVTDDYVYQHVAGHGLLAIDKKTGQLAWKLKEGIDLLAEDGRKVYVMAENNKIVVMDNKKLEKINEIDAPEVTNWITNTVDSMMYLADESGRIMCVKPIEY
jgi:hypothetical protein